MQGPTFRPGRGERLLARGSAGHGDAAVILGTLGGRSPRATVPPPELGAALRSREAFARFALDLEAQAVAKIKSPHVVQVFDHGSLPDGTP